MLQVCWSLYEQEDVPEFIIIEKVVEFLTVLPVFVDGR